MKEPIEFVRFKDNFRALPDLFPLIGLGTFEMRRAERIIPMEDGYLEKLKLAAFLIHHTSGTTLYGIGAIEVYKGLEKLIS